ncbi:MAG: hypothetical protein JRF38_00010, partial [Deltaproteobacteria bacterium]|nr:hypothetical protein [Deltaproteobacteria bacterium]
YRFEGDVLWITLRECKTLEEALRPFERAMTNPNFKPGLTVVWDLTLQRTVLTQDENSRGLSATAVLALKSGKFKRQTSLDRFNY